ncbi:blue copper protein-like [Chenopodium quinoa]|uniref:blue copper protein-like n=1 Tax=Chenopodium quinoa TaxID=63459 RepID=UPI000B78F02C|nr:blue copper protein-like [Chenopodium quinoa]
MNKQISTIAISYITILIYLGYAQVITVKVYMVGDNHGWGPGNDYSKWVKGKTFYKGDILVFRYAEGYSVDEVDAKRFKKCDSTYSLYSATDGNSSITLTKSGVHYFIGGLFNECSQGMNLTLTVN